MSITKELLNRVIENTKYIEANHMKSLHIEECLERYQESNKVIASILARATSPEEERYFVDLFEGITKRKIGDTYGFVMKYLEVT